MANGVAFRVRALTGRRLHVKLADRFDSRLRGDLASSGWIFGFLYPCREGLAVEFSRCHRRQRCRRVLQEIHGSAVDLVRSLYGNVEFRPIHGA